MAAAALSDPAAVAAALKMVDLLVCPKCDQLFSQPRTLPCMHHFCKECVSECDECPTCRQRFFPRDAKDNKVLAEISDNLRKLAVLLPPAEQKRALSVLGGQGALSSAAPSPSPSTGSASSRENGSSRSGANGPEKRAAEEAEGPRAAAASAKRARRAKSGVSPALPRTVSMRPSPSEAASQTEDDDEEEKQEGGRQDRRGKGRRNRPPRGEPLVLSAPPEDAGHAPLVRSQRRTRSEMAGGVVRSEYAHCVIACSGLDEATMEKARRLCRELGGEVVSSFSPLVTHVVCQAVREGRDVLARRTLKYMCGVAGGKWVVSEDWLAACAEAHAWLREDAFVIQGDTVHRVPGVLHGRRGLFAGRTFVLHPPFQNVTPHELRTLIIAGGGRVLDSLPPLPSGMRSPAADQTRLAITAQDLPAAQARVILARSGFLPVSMVWLLDSASLAADVPLKEYLILE